MIVPVSDGSKFLFERRYRTIEHTTMRFRSRGIALRPRSGERQLERLPAVFSLALFRGKRGPERLLALSLGLLELDVFTLEAASHSPVF